VLDSLDDDIGLLMDILEPGFPELFDGERQDKSKGKEEANIAIAETALLDVATKSALKWNVYDLQANLENIQTASVALGTGKEALRLARFTPLVGAYSTDVINAENDLTNAEGIVTAILDYNPSIS